MTANCGSVNCNEFMITEWLCQAQYSTLLHHISVARKRMLLYPLVNSPLSCNSMSFFHRSRLFHLRQIEDEQLCTPTHCSCFITHALVLCHLDLASPLSFDFACFCRSSTDSHRHCITFSSLTMCVVRTSAMQAQYLSEAYFLGFLKLRLFILQNG